MYIYIYDIYIYHIYTYIFIKSVDLSGIRVLNTLIIRNTAFCCLNWSLVCVQTLFCFTIVLFILGNSAMRLFIFDKTKE